MTREPFSRAAILAANTTDQLNDRFAFIGIPGDCRPNLVEAYVLGYTEGWDDADPFPSRAVALVNELDREFRGLSAWLYADGYAKGADMRLFREQFPELFGEGWTWA